jgi:hypothetical protein
LHKARIGGAKGVSEAVRVGKKVARGMRVYEIAMNAGPELVDETSEAEMPDEEPLLGRLPGWAKWSALIAGIAGVILLLWWNEGAERRAIRDMPETERQALYTRTMQNLTSVCAPADDALRGFCQEQARLAMEFRECDQACLELADRQLSRVQPPR